jgi:hypothetical protein
MASDDGAAAKLDAILAGMAGISSRMDAMENEIKARKDADEKSRRDAEEAKARFDSARKDRFGARKDGESRKDYVARHDADEAWMMDALKDSPDCAKSVRDARKDAEDAEAKQDEGFEEWAKEESREPAHRSDARKDGEAEEKPRAPDMEKEVSMKDGVEIAGLREQIAALSNIVRSITAETPAADRDALARAQSRADSVAAMFGERAPQPFPGERPLDYRKRALSKFQRHSERFKDSRLDSLDDATLSATEEHVYHDAQVAARSPATPTAGRLIGRTERIGGRDITTFTGDPMAWMGAFMTGPQSGDFVRPQNRS